jgi:hypothetical protein
MKLLLCQGLFRSDPYLARPEFVPIRGCHSVGAYREKSLFITDMEMVLSSF